MFICFISFNPFTPKSKKDFIFICESIEAAAASAMATFTNQEYADIHYMYGLADGNAHEAQRLYAARFPDRRMPDSRVFSSVHRRLCENGKFEKKQREVGHAGVRDVVEEERILEMVADDPTTSTRRLSRETGVSKTQILRILKKNDYKPYHYTPVQDLEEHDFVPRTNFCRWLLNKDIEEHHFLRKILWTDESLFTREGIFNCHNLHHWATENPRLVRVTSTQRRFSCNVWAGIIGDRIIGPHFFDGPLNGETYLNFLRDDLPQLLDELDPDLRQTLVFQHDGAPPHYSAAVRRFLNNQYPNWIGRGGVTAWPPRSPDLTPMDYFLWGFIKQEVYSSVVLTFEDLRGRIIEAFQNVQGILSHKMTVHQMRKRARYCIRSNGMHFENML